MSKKYPNNLSNYRKYHKLKQLDMNYFCDKPNSVSLSRYEKGEYLPDIETLITYAIVLNVPIKDLIPDMYGKVFKKLTQKTQQLLQDFNEHHFSYKRFKRKAFLDNLLERISCLKEVHDNTPTQHKEDHSGDFPQQ